jgi:hypothetical protein
VDDILIIYDKNKTHIDTVMVEFSTIHPAKNFTIVNEANKKLNFFDLIMH